MNFNTKEDIQNSFSTNFGENSFSHRMRMIMYKFLNEIEIATDEQNISRKKLAQLIGTSPSYITQLFRGDKIINLNTLAKLQDALNIEFEISSRKIGEKKTEISATVVALFAVNKSNLIATTSTMGDGLADKKNENSSPYKNNSFQEKLSLISYG